VSRGPEVVPVPAVASVSLPRARALLAGVGLRVGDVRQAYDDDVPAGQVVGATPAPAERVRQGTVVDLVVSRGPAPVRVPDLRAVPQQDALATLRGLGLRGVVASSAFDEGRDPAPAGTVLSQDRRAGTTVGRGSRVRLVISKGPPVVTVPKVVGLQAKEARKVLKAQGFDVKLDEFLGAFFGTVRTQDPEPGAQVPAGSLVTLLVV
jgi:serine/threonine-protein kinase